MGTNHGGDGPTIAVNMGADINLYDELPEVVRTAIREATGAYSAEEAFGYLRYMTAEDAAAAIRESDLRANGPPVRRKPRERRR
jgi:hypothetical protein